MRQIPDWPRMMKAATAARYCDLSTPDFLREVAAGRLPAAIRLGSHDHWDKTALDEDLNHLAGRSNDWRKDQPGLAA